MYVSVKMVLYIWLEIKVHDLLLFCYANSSFLQHAETTEEDFRNDENVEPGFLRQERYISSKFSSV